MVHPRKDHLGRDSFKIRPSAFYAARKVFKSATLAELAMLEEIDREICVVDAAR